MEKSKFLYLNSSDELFRADKGTTGFINGYEYVDLGLSVKWATCNVGASSPSDYGDYFAWGETKTKFRYTESNSVTYGKWVGSIAGDPKYDAATANWGGDWRMPTKEEMDELMDKCTWKWTEMEGHKGYEVTGPNGRSIFLPAAGWCFGSSLYDVGERGYCWSASPYGGGADYAFSLLFYEGRFLRHWHRRSFGQSVRPVIGKTSETGQSQSSASSSGGATTSSTASSSSKPATSQGGNAQTGTQTSALSSSTSSGTTTQTTTSSATNSSSGTASPTIGKINGHEYVDLGLSVNWATCNVGASTPEEYGDYYAWGETEPKSEYAEENSVTYLRQMGSIEGNLQYDVARVYWGGTWRMPTYEQIGELIYKCTWKWVEMNGHEGYEVTGPNGRSIFLPAAGWRNGWSLYDVGKDGYYWSATPLEDSYFALSAYRLAFTKGYFDRNHLKRGNGHSVRPVIGKTSETGKSQSSASPSGSATTSSATNSSSGTASPTIGIINGHDYVDLGLSVKWATCNVGASAPSDYGNYYAWGETTPKSEYTLDNSVTFDKLMGSIAGDPHYDAATANWGGTWRMPTKEEIDELVSKCIRKWVVKDGYGGYEVTGPNGRSIFLPAAGWRDGSSLYDVGENGSYWGATHGIIETIAYGLGFFKGNFHRGWNTRGVGQSVRPVSD